MNFSKTQENWDRWDQCRTVQLEYKISAKKMFFFFFFRSVLLCFELLLKEMSTVENNRYSCSLYDIPRCQKILVPYLMALAFWKTLFPIHTNVQCSLQTPLLFTVRYTCNWPSACSIIRKDCVNCDEIFFEMLGYVSIYMKDFFISFWTDVFEGNWSKASRQKSPELKPSSYVLLQ